MKNFHRQSWKGSAAESVFNVAIGFGVAFAAWEFVCLPLIEAGKMSVGDSFLITCIFTAISLLRTFAIRRAYTLYADWKGGKWS